mgnify:CR=1 FL=1
MDLNFCTYLCFFHNEVCEVPIVHNMIHEDIGTNVDIELNEDIGHIM